MNVATMISLGSSSHSLGLSEALAKGGPIIWPILGCSVITFGVLLERWVYYRRCELNVPEFLTGILALVRRGRYEEAIARCEETWGPVPELVRKAIVFRSLPPAELREVLRETALTWLPALEARLPIVATIATITPLLGFLGTVFAMMQTFSGLSQSLPALSIQEIAEGIWAALVSTGFGLAVAILSWLAYHLLCYRVYRMIDDLEHAIVEITHALVLGQTTTPSPSPTPPDSGRVASPIIHDGGVDRSD
ncbi:MotA/TolQ/ExbB proton channel family protein [Candidatus Methylacidithermus pantelleriae]|uniref:MotA/TolQ/ExbB proton channel domain-containing protein n=1 Tax=Candidatus Methylacidithermus pantelleriae TaxID=2744239 RepID=A0A8J2FRH0_9BACT|nr:MotA/TolQ/ExbB proton channel family protein [Candidatus Methylacidithermus pantelleriae]CAF0688860.1 membrane hypothetical protein [Candidatus Methylacidithermus pantelleriae]